MGSGPTGDELDEITLDIPMDAGTGREGSNINRTALTVWDQLLSTNNMLTIIGENSFTRGVLRLLNPQQQEEIMKLTRTNMIDRREIIRKMISNIRKEPINFPPNLTDIKKPRSYNKMKDSKGAKVSNPTYHHPLAIEHIVDSTEIIF